MRFDALELALVIIALLRRILPAIRRHDSKLTNQLRDAGSSVALNLGEGSRRRGRDRLHFFTIASGSAEEVRTALRVALAWGYVTEHSVRESLEDIDRLQSILWKLMG